MKINDSTYSSQSLQAIKSKALQPQVPYEPATNRVEKKVESNTPNQEQSRFDVNDNAIALVKEQYSAQASTGNSAQNNSNKSNFSQYDQPSKQHQTAVAAYSTVDNLAQRENIKDVFGVNLFA